MMMTINNNNLMLFRVPWLIPLRWSLIRNLKYKRNKNHNHYISQANNNINNIHNPNLNPNNFNLLKQRNLSTRKVNHLARIAFQL